MLDMTANRIVLARIQPDADAVNTTIYLNTFNALGPKRTTAFRASQRALTFPRPRSSRTSCWGEGSGIH